MGRVEQASNKKNLSFLQYHTISLSVIFFSKDDTDGYDQNYFVDFNTNHVEMVQLASSYFATCTPKLVTLTFQHPKTPKSSLLLAGLTGQATQGDFAWV
jgi:hypothetical protein